MLILGVLKNRIHTLERTWTYLVDTVENIPNTKVCIYENNSTDGTKEILQKYDEMYDWLTVYSEDLTDEYLNNNIKLRTNKGKLSTVELITLARNTLLNNVAHDIDKFDYVLWIDPDDGKWDYRQILKNLQRDPKTWDAIFCNDINTKSDLYYDTFALRYDGYFAGREITGKKLVPKISFNRHRTKLSLVYSAFGGMGLYKSSFFKSNRYKCTIDEMYARVCEKILKKHDYRAAVNGTERVGNVTFYKNTGHNKTSVICEHTYFNFQLIDQGHDKLFVDPQWLYERSYTDYVNSVPKVITIVLSTFALLMVLLMCIKNSRSNKETTLFFLKTKNEYKS